MRELIDSHYSSVREASCSAAVIYSLVNNYCKYSENKECNQYIKDEVYQNRLSNYIKQQSCMKYSDHWEDSDYSLWDSQCYRDSAIRTVIQLYYFRSFRVYSELKELENLYR